MCSSDLLISTHTALLPIFLQNEKIDEIILKSQLFEIDFKDLT